jgi:hypothetical protein
MAEWVRHITSNDPSYHVLAAVVFGGSLITRCRGRWPEQDAIESHDDPPVSKCCKACLREVVA